MPVVIRNHLDKLMHWIVERHSVFLKKEQGLPKPWTADPILRGHFFTNPYRENDKVTRWYAKNIREPLASSPHLVFATVCFRWFNWPATGEVLLRHSLLTNWSTAKAVDVLAKIKAAGVQVFTGAYNISNSGSAKPKVNRVCEDYLEPVWQVQAALTKGIAGHALSEAHKAISKMPGMGGSGFMAAQVVADLKYAKLLRGAPDWHTWCSPGPGSIRGLNLVLAGKLGDAKPKNFLIEINKIREYVNSKLPARMPPLHAQDVQNCLCELSKYERASLEGYSKRRYPGC